MGSKRKAKHVIQAEQQKSQKNDEEGDSSSSNLNVAKVQTKKRQRKNKNKGHVKDPQEAHSYLSLWQQNLKLKEENEDVQPIWRFNKNTQSWLLRHMYEVDKINKATFTILLSYLKALKGSSRERVHEDAVRRALRYKEWEKDHQSDEDVDTNAESDEKDGANDVEEDDDDDQERYAKLWKRLDSNGKRKEYKRSRKVIETLKSSSKND